MRTAAVALLAALAFATASGCALVTASLAAAAATPKTSLADIEDEVMCVECGTPLEVSDSPVANQERALIRRDIARGMTKAQIKADLVDQYGPAVLAQPSDSGFDLSAWIVPIVLVVLAAAGVVLVARRWRRAQSGARATAAAEPPPLDPEAAARLEADLAAHDR